MTDMGNKPAIRVLVVEDDSDTAEVMAFGLPLLSANGIGVETAGNVASAICKLLAHSADVVLLDLCLPDSTGLETIDKIIAASGSVPIIVVSGNPEFELDALRHGAQDFLCKTHFSLEAMLLAVRRSSARAEYRKPPVSSPVAGACETIARVDRVGESFKKADQLMDSAAAKRISESAGAT